MTPTEVVADLLALSVVEHSYSGVEIRLQLAHDTAVITDTGRGMKVDPDEGDTMSHAQRALTSTFPVRAGRSDVEEALTDLVWGEGQSMGPSAANAACPRFEFRSRRAGEEWCQVYHDGVPDGPAVRLGPADGSGTTIKLTTGGAIDRAAIVELGSRLRSRIADLQLVIEPAVETDR